MKIKKFDMQWLDNWKDSYSIMNHITINKKKNVIFKVDLNNTDRKLYNRCVISIQDSTNTGTEYFIQLYNKELEQWETVASLYLDSYLSNSVSIPFHTDFKKMRIKSKTKKISNNQSLYIQVRLFKC